MIEGSKNRIFTLGDSFTENLFKSYDENSFRDHVKESEMFKFLTDLKESHNEKPLWWTDWLEKWGYEVHNLGIGGCSNEEVTYQLGKIDKNFIDGDRIIINWTHYIRFLWISNDGTRSSILPNHTSKFFNEQSILRDYSWENKNGYLNQTLKPFINNILNFIEKYRPILWSPFDEICDVIDSNKWYFNRNLTIGVNTLFSIKSETNELIDDNHYGRYGNHNLAVIFDELLKYEGDGHYVNDSELIEKINKRLKKDKINFITPKNWEKNKKII